MAGCPMEIIAGNNDFFSNLKKEKYISIGKYRAFLTHGHQRQVARGIETLFSEITDADIVMFGHTHRPVITRHQGRIYLNPGSLSYPRQEGRVPSYIIMEIDKNGNAHYTLNYLKNT